MTFDSICDQVGAYNWIDDRLGEESLLTHPNVGCLTFMGAADFEMLCALMANGASALDIFRKKTTGDWRFGSMNGLLYEIAPKGARLKTVVDSYDVILSKLKLDLFGK